MSTSSSSSKASGAAALPLGRLIPNFDPRQVPVQGVDTHLPAVPLQHQTAQALRQRFATPPQWQPEIKGEPRMLERPPAQAAVLVPLVQREELMVLLTQRSMALTHHSGQIAFPGGRQDPEDGGNLATTALREAQEEVGLQPQWVEVLGTLPVYETVSAYRVTPVVGLVQPHAHLQLNADEVADAFEVPLSFLLNPAHHRRHHLRFEGGERQWWSMPYQDGPHERFIWGATAAMLRNFYRFMIA